MHLDESLGKCQYCVFSTRTIKNAKWCFYCRAHGIYVFHTVLKCRDFLFDESKMKVEGGERRRDRSLLEFGFGRRVRFEG